MEEEEEGEEGSQRPLLCTVYKRSRTSERQEERAKGAGGVGVNRVADERFRGAVMVVSLTFK